jgi:hypothetical protein
MAVKNSQRFAEIERLMGDYFGCHLAPVMGRVQRDLSNRQADEMRAYSNSTAGILRSLATANMPGDDPYATLKITGKWNSKTTEDYLAMCKEAIVGNKDMQRDLAVMAEEWRKAVVTEIGRERYDALSKQLGCDLAYAYIDHRMEQLMIEKMVKDRMPTSSADYIIRKAAQSSLFGLPYELNKSPLAAEIEAKGEAAYKPSRTEKAAGWAAGAGADVVAMGGIGSWATFAKFVGIDMVMNVGMEHLSKKGSSQEVCVEECISKGVFGSDSNVFDSFRKEAASIPGKENTALAAANGKLQKKIPIVTFDFMDWWKTDNRNMPWREETAEEERKRVERYKDVPMVVAPGQEEAYLQDMERRKAETEEQTESKPKQREKEEKEVSTSAVSAGEGMRQEQAGQGTQTIQTNENGWDELVRSLGLDGIGDVAGNLGYILAMLPDILLGVFTGRTQSLGLKDNLLPIASIVAGMFVKNPMLKMLLIGLGGANLLNKAGHEVLGKERTEGNRNAATTGREVQYRRYPDEPLNPRIVNPALQGCTLVATIDRVPCTVQLTPAMADAYRAGALPLNTLANAVLAQSDKLRQMASQNYDNGQQETIVRTRGIQ